jgi:hypothetical protein
MTTISGTNDKKTTMIHPQKKINVILTASDSLFFDSLLLLIGSIFEYSYESTDYILVFDLGLDQNEVNLLNSMSKVILINYHTEDIKYLNSLHFDFFDKKTYGFKVYTLSKFHRFLPIKKFDIVNCLYIDAGICLNKDILSIFELINSSGFFCVDHDDGGEYRGSQIRLLNIVSPILYTSKNSCKFDLLPNEILSQKQYIKAGFLGYQYKGRYQNVIDKHYELCTKTDVLVLPKAETCNKSKNWYVKNTGVKNWLIQNNLNLENLLYVGSRQDQTSLSYLVSASDIPIHNSRKYNFTESGYLTEDQWNNGFKSILAKNIQFFIDDIRLKIQDSINIEQKSEDEIFDTFINVFSKKQERNFVERKPIIFPRHKESINALTILHRGTLAQKNGWKFSGKFLNNFANINNSDTFILLGNGPSLGDVDLKSLEPYATFGLNAAYRAYIKLNFWPKYFGCFDSRVCAHHSEQFENLIHKSPIERFFFINYNENKKSIFTDHRILSHPKFQKINFKERTPQEKERDDILACSFDPFIDMLTSGTNAIQCALLMGYRKIILLGCDANYVEVVEGAKQETNKNKLLMDRTPTENPNYWFSDYQQQGDKFNLPNTLGCQLPAWGRLDRTMNRLNIEAEIINCSPISKIKDFKKMDLCDALKYFSPNSNQTNSFDPGNKDHIGSKSKIIFNHNYKFDMIKNLGKVSIEKKQTLLDIVQRSKNIATIIIGVQLGDSNNDLRYSNLKFLIDFIAHFFGDIFDILIIEQDSTSRISVNDLNTSLHIRHEFIYNPSCYNRGWGYNVAVKNFCYDSEVIVLMDIDILPGSNFLTEIINCYSKFDFISPYQHIYYTDKNEASKIISTFHTDMLNNQKRIKNPVTLSGGILIAKKNLYLVLQGFEQYVGYGGEDRAFDVTIMNHISTSKIRVASEVYAHLYHPKQEVSGTSTDEIFSHLSANYNCKFDTTLGPFEPLHKNCKHVSKLHTLKNMISRSTSFGDIHLYKNFKALNVNGTISSTFNKSIPTSCIYPVYDDLFYDYPKRELYKAPEADSNEIRQFYNAFKGKRCFIVGNGPSLNQHDLSFLKNEYSFGVNNIFYKTKECGYIPTFFVVEDSSVMNENIEQINNYQAPFKFFPTIYKSLSSKGPNTFFFKMNRGFYEKTSPNYVIPRFSTDASQVLYCGQSVTFINLQLAFFMGFTEVYLIGMDFSYEIPTSHIRKGDVLYSDTDDQNHFHKDYFGKGKTWKDPKLERVAMNYKMAKLVYEGVGRKIYNATIGGKLDVFDRVDFLNLFENKLINKTNQLKSTLQYSGSFFDNPQQVNPVKIITQPSNIGIEANQGSIVVVGNGSSLQNFNFGRLTSIKSIGMNAAYRHWKTTGIYPNYYICLDTVVIESLKVEIYDLIQKRSENGIQLFFLRKKMLKFYPELYNTPEVVFLEDYFNSPYFEGIIQGITTGSFAALLGAMLGYKQIFLLGIDLNYVQVIPEAKRVNRHILEMTQTPLKNPNYFFEGYQKKGDRFNVPDSKPDLHYNSWLMVKDRLERLEVDVLNCNPKSRLDIFDYADINEILPCE